LHHAASPVYETIGITMSTETFYKDNWIEIDPARLARYEKMFAWNPASASLFKPAQIETGQTIAEFGCGPGHMAIELAKWVGPDGHIHALDINSAFVVSARNLAMSVGLGDQITVDESDGSRLPLPDGSCDRILARNTIIYVEDPVVCFREFKRVLKPGGKAHVIEGDWPMMVVEPVPSEEWATLVNAASHACRTPDMGRKLHRLFRQAGFAEIRLQVMTNPDTDGRLLAMIRNMAEYARNSGKMDEERIDAVIETLESAVENGTYLALAPQFVVTAST
jgi:ubiquinone/menaquinone biosynthesis C-methylase UbiE